MNLREQLSFGRGVRCFINQPSTLQPLHQYSGQLCIAFQGDHSPESGMVDIYFTHGEVSSMVAPILSLSPVHSAGDKELYVVCGYNGDYDAGATRLVEASGYNEAQELLISTHFPGVQKVDIQFCGTLTDLLADVLK